MSARCNSANDGLHSQHSLSVNVLSVWWGKSCCSLALFREPIKTLRLRDFCAWLGERSCEGLRFFECTLWVKHMDRRFAFFNTLVGPHARGGARQDLCETFFPSFWFLQALLRTQYVPVLYYFYIVRRQDALHEKTKMKARFSSSSLKSIRFYLQIQFANSPIFDNRLSFLNITNVAC